MPKFRVLLMLCLSLCPSAALAASLQVSPVTLEVAAPGRASTLTIRNLGEKSLGAQIRVFRWTQIGGVERLEATQDVVASPPFVDLKPRQDYVLRVIRVSGRPVIAEEAYRVVVDELPTPQLRSGTVALMLRHVVPLFFGGQEVSTAAPSFSVMRRGDAMMLRVANRGESRVRLSAVSIHDSSGRSSSVTPGLLGYALARSEMQWRMPIATGRLPAGSRIRISGMADRGPFNATSIVTASE